MLFYISSDFDTNDLIDNTNVQKQRDTEFRKWPKLDDGVNFEFNRKTIHNSSDNPSLY